MKKTNKVGNLGILVFLLACFAVSVVLWMGRASSRLIANTANQVSSLYLRELTGATGKHLQTALKYHFNQMDSVAQMLTEETASDEEKFRRYMDQMKEKQGFSFLAFVDEEGCYHDGTGVYSAASNISFMGKLLKGENYLISYNEQVQTKNMIMMGVRMNPISVGDTTYIALLASMNVDDMSRSMVLVNEQSQTYSSIVTSDGTYVILSNMKGQLRGSNILSALKKTATFIADDELKDITAKLQTGGQGMSLIETEDGGLFYLYYMPLENTDWHLVTLMPYEVIEGTIRELGSTISHTSTAIFSTFFGVIIFLFVSYMWLSFKKQTQLEEAKKAAEQAFQIAEQANSAKSVFLSNMSHDIRTPMNAIVGFVTLLTRDADKPDKVLEYAKKIAHSSQHLLSLLNDVLDMAKIESGKMTLHVAKANLADIIEDINVIIRPQMKAKGHQFDIHIHNISHEVIYVDKLRVHQILLNLLSNAVKYTPEGGNINLEVTELKQASKQYAKYRFRVEDNGYGIEEKYLQFIFDVFSREQDSVINKIQGTGLGLAITKNLVDLMGGDIRVESEKGKGSVFTVDLEMMIAEDIDAGKFWSENHISRILVVDDEESVCKNVEWTMENLGVAVDYALEGTTAIEMVMKAEEEQEQYHTILLDWKMPGKDGIEVAREIRKTVPSNISIMILTSYDYSEIEDELLEGVIDGFIAKPFFESNFRQKLQEILNETEKAEIIDKSAGSLEGMHILVAEDNELNAEILLDLLQMEGASCEIYGNGQLAYDAFVHSEENTYQLILMDVQMPVMNGYQATRLIRDSMHPQARTIPVIAMTANAFAEDVKNAMDAGMTAHMAKPLDMANLRKIVEDIFCRKKD